MKRTIRTALLSTTLAIAALTVTTGIAAAETPGPQADLGITGRDTPGDCGAATAPDAPGIPAASDTAPAQVGVPTRVEIPAIEVDEELVPVGLLDNGAMQTPDFGVAAWYELGPRPGEPGPAVVLAHVDSQAGPDVFHQLRELAPGDRVTVHGQDGSATFVVDSSDQVDKDRLPYDRIWTDTTDPVLRLITCGGSFDAGTGHYRDNVIVYAHLVGG